MKTVGQVEGGYGEEEEGRREGNEGKGREGREKKCKGPGAEASARCGKSRINKTQCK